MDRVRVILRKRHFQDQYRRLTLCFTVAQAVGDEVGAIERALRRVFVADAFRTLVRARSAAMSLSLEQHDLRQVAGAAV
jgi:hypothetical protein